MKIIGVIPARYESSRFPGKPMVWWVYQQSIKVRELNEVYMATDNATIFSACKELDMRVIMTSDKHKTGTDRVGEVVEKIKADLYINIQGDAPLLEPDTIRAAILPFYENADFKFDD